MSIEIKKLNKPLPYDKIGDLLYKTYFTSYKDSGALQWNEKYAEIYFTAWVLPKSDELIFGAWDNDKLIGLCVGHKENVKLDNEIDLTTSNIGLTAVDPEYQKQGIATSLIKKLLEDAKSLGYDLILSMTQKGKLGDKILKKLEFSQIGKHEHYIKIMEKYGVQILKEYRGLNPILAKLAEKLYSKLPMDEISGKIRKGIIPDDVPRCLEILNSYASRVPLARIVSEDVYIKDLNGSSKLKDEFGEPWGLTWYLLEIDGKIMGTITSRIEITTFEKGSAPVALLGNFGCDSSLTLDQKKGFLAEVIRTIRNDYPEVFTCQITSLHHELRVFKNLDFTDDQETYLFLIYPLTEKANEISARYKKMKEFFLSYYR
ncbi:MAG: GNAT family N-acetyltransferase [Candidatus Helarchaeota archaeon]